ncbi:MAG: hypothetical protein WEA54_00790 [Actinomycetota bacterium]
MRGPVRDTVRAAVRAAVAAAVAGAVLAHAGPAVAGGSLLETGSTSRAVGETVTARAEFCRRGQYHGTLADGPFFTYLVPEDARSGRDPSPDAIAVGELVISEGGECTHIAQTTFTVPDVAAGWYAIDYCNDPCTIDGIYEVVHATGFWIADTPAQAAILMRVDRLRTQVDSLRLRARRNRQAAVELSATRRELTDVRSRLEEAQSEATFVEQQLSDVRRRNIELRSKLDGSLVAPNGLASGLAIALVVLLVVALVLLVRRRGGRSGSDGHDRESAGSGMVPSPRSG